MSIVFISVGSNIEPEKYVHLALRLLKKHIKVLDISNFYLTNPIEAPGTPRFYNGMIKAETDFAPHYLKQNVLKNIESTLGREKNHDKNAPRTIDLDIILFDELIINEPNFKIPDPDLFERYYLAFTLAQLAPDMILPGTQKNISELVDDLNSDGLEELVGFTCKLKEEL